MSVGDTINHVENALRDLVQLVLQDIHGKGWFDHLGVSEDRIQGWRERRDEELRRRPGGLKEDRLLYYSDIYDVIGIIDKNWSKRVF